MRGLYINCDDNNIPASKHLSQQYSQTYQFCEGDDKGQVIYNPREWLSAPVQKIEQHTIIVAGWFVYKGQKNNLESLTQDLIQYGTSALVYIEIGSFIIYWHDGLEAKVLVDPMGLSTHYIDKKSICLRVAPSVKALYNESQHSLNVIMQSVLKKKNHLFGNFTLYDGILRLSPSAVVSIREKETIKIIDEECDVAISDLGSSLNQVSQYWQKEQRILPLSAGLDSRYILANASFEYGFTYGPENSPEINITGEFANDFSDYYAFDFAEQPLYVQEQEVLDEMSFGVVNPIPRLLTNYLHVKDKYPQANAYFEGYLGDVFQRGTFVTFKGALGELFKLFPFAYRVKKFTAQYLLRRRYIELNKEEFTLLWDDFNDKTQHLALNDYQKVTYYEFLYGRGGRYAIFGSNILAAQIFTVISPFTHKTFFSRLIKQDFAEAVSYKTMKKLWQRSAIKYTKIKVESGYTPKSFGMFIPVTQLLYRLMFHFIPSRANYGVQMKRENDKQK